MATIGLSGGIGALLGSWFEHVRRSFDAARQRRRIYVQTFEELSSLSDRELTDIGISRLQIGDVAREAAYSQPAA